MSQQAPGIHWLVVAVERSGLGDASTCGCPADTEIGKAWDWVADFLKVSHDDLAQAVSKAFRLGLADLSRAEPEARALLPVKVARRYRVVPLRATDRDLVVATSEPLDFEAEREIGFVSGRRTVFEVATPAAIQKALEEGYTAGGRADTLLTDVALEEAFQRVKLDAVAAARATDAPESVIKVARLIVYQAVQSGVQEVHIAPRASVGHVLFRTDSGFSTFVRLPMEVLVRVVARIRALAGLREHREVRETGTVPLRVDEVPYEVTVHTVPSNAEQLILQIARRETGRKQTPLPTSPEAWKPATQTTEGHVLVVDDDPGGRMLMRTVLEKNGFAVSEADDGATALPFLDRHEDIDLVLLDLMMKQIDGLETLKRIRKNVKTAGLPVVILTGSQNPDDERRLIGAGADDYLRKPIDPHQLVARLKAVLARARSYLD
ncbi:MAG: response regulator [Gemmatimonadetes bacterium]|nr:MAG: response regulator [Gemmatimonadota bacterium]